MERQPDVGLIQTLPTDRQRHHACSRACSSSPAASTGRSSPPACAWWHGAEGNYWGHNAIIRTRAFADCGGLPELPGSKPFGGHDPQPRFRRGGADPPRRLGGAHGPRPRRQLRGSAADAHRSRGRDRRWCQGNLQHAAVLPSARSALGQPLAFHDRHRPLLHRAHVGDVATGRHCDPVRAYRLGLRGRPACRAVSGGVLEIARSGADPLAVRCQHGRVVRSQGAGLSGHAGESCGTPRLRRRFARADRAY